MRSENVKAIRFRLTEGDADELTKEIKTCLEAVLGKKPPSTLDMGRFAGVLFDRVRMWIESRVVEVEAKP